jgi:lycopene cyclase domain-containing protein
VTYTAAAVLGVAAALLVDLVVLRTRLVTRRVWWTAYAIVVGFQLAANGVLTGRRMVVYAPDAVLSDGGPRLAGDWRLVYAPVEDLAFGFAMILLTLSVWVWLGRRGVQREPAAGARQRSGCRRARTARASPGSATAARRPTPTDTRRSSTR